MTSSAQTASATATAGAAAATTSSTSNTQGHNHGGTATTKLQGTWQDRSDLVQKLASPTKATPYSSGGPAFTFDAVTGKTTKTTTVFAPYLFNGIRARNGIADGKKYSGTLNGAKVSYFNGRVNFYVDQNKNNTLDAKDQLKGQINVDAYEGAPDLSGKSGTWALDTANKLYIHDQSGELLVAMSVPKGIF